MAEEVQGGEVTEGEQGVEDTGEVEVILLQRLMNF